jgi:hypothetical protein
MADMVVVRRSKRAREGTSRTSAKNKTETKKTKVQTLKKSKRGGGSDGPSDDLDKRVLQCAWKPCKKSARVEDVRFLEQIPNCGVASARDYYKVLGLRTVGDFKREDPVALWTRLSLATGVRHDPCVVDVFAAVRDFMRGGPVRAWWAYSKDRLPLPELQIGQKT